jgi:hypothetical protein
MHLPKVNLLSAKDLNVSSLFIQSLTQHIQTQIASSIFVYGIRQSASGVCNWAQVKQLIQEIP